MKKDKEKIGTSNEESLDEVFKRIVKLDDIEKTEISIDYIDVPKLVLIKGIRLSFRSLIAIFAFILILVFYLLA